MTQLLIGISGLAGAGKDTVGAILAGCYGFASMAFADPMKRAVAEWFDWGQERLWGPSANRNAVDGRYGGLTARKALQFLGTEIGRELYGNVWVDLGLRNAGKVLAGAGYGPKEGVIVNESIAWEGVAITDVRFANELEAIRAAGGFLVRVTRPGSGLGGAAGLHASEREQAAIPDSAFDAVLSNDGTIDDLAHKVEEALTSFRAAARK